MDSQLLIKKTPKYITSLAYALIALSIFSCCSRPDYNVIIGFLILLLRSHDASDRKQFFTKYYYLVFFIYFGLLNIQDFGGMEMIQLIYGNH